MVDAAMQIDASRWHLRQIIAGLVEGVLLVEPSGAIVWVNEAALAMHDCRRAGDLGVTVAQLGRRFALTYLNHHALQVKQYPVARAARGEAFSDVTVRVTRRRGAGGEPRVHTWRSVPLAAADGTLEAVALVGKDVTAQVSAEERFERAFNANPAPALICRLADRQYIKVNRGFLAMTGYDAAQVLAWRFRQLDVLRGAEHRDAALVALREGEPIAQQEARVRCQPGSDKFVIVAGLPIEVGDAACMLFTFIDLDARKQAEIALKRSEEQFAKAFRLAPAPMLVCTQAGWRIRMVNAAFGATTGYAPADAEGKTVSALGLWHSTKALVALRAAAQAGKGVRQHEAPLRTRAGTVLDCLVSIEPVTMNDEACVLCLIEDVTDRRRSEAELVAAIEAVMKDASWFSHTVMEKLAQLRAPRAGQANTELATLTPRERQVLELICRGKTNAEIASQLGLARNTVRNHVALLYDKTGVNRRSAAVVWGRERGVGGY